jgi:hypothetical protein
MFKRKKIMSLKAARGWFAHEGCSLLDFKIMDISISIAIGPNFHRFISAFC